MSVCGGTRIFWGGQREGFLFSVLKGGPEFFEDQIGGTNFFPKNFLAPLAQFTKPKGGIRIFTHEKGDQKTDGHPENLNSAAES